MSNVYLVRHGQAGTRDDYDSLSDLGRRQSRLLGEYFLSQSIEFTKVYSGAMLRQRDTAAEVAAGYSAGSLSLPETIVDDRWNEFDLAQVYREIAPQLCDADQVFRNEYDEMRQQVRQSAGDHQAQVHRRWRPCDTKLVEAWIAGRFPYSGETWKQFRERVQACRAALSDGSRQANILVFTSATPAAILSGLALDVPDDHVRRLAGVLYNSSYTVLRQREQHLQLFQFNAVPHLTKPELRTHR